MRAEQPVNNRTTCTGKTWILRKKSRGSDLSTITYLGLIRADSDCKLYNVSKYSLILSKVIKNKYTGQKRRTAKNVKETHEKIPLRTKGFYPD